MKLFDALRQQDSRTEKGAVTNSTSLNPLVDLFSMAGATRSKSQEEIEEILLPAFIENKELATKLVFWAGDIRGGAGERRFFKTALRFINKNYPEIYKANIENIPHYNRFDSLFQFSDKSTLNFVKAELDRKNGLAAKWMPREGKANHQAFLSEFLKHTGLSKKNYRKLVAGLSKTVEQDLSARRFSKVEYSKVPSVAFNKYRKAFKRNDETRFINFLESVEKGESKINAGAIFPHDIYKSVRTGGDERSINAQWASLPNYLENSNERILPVCDVSGSMTCANGLPMDISVSLGLYLSERNVGTFKDCFMSFSYNPNVYKVSGTLTERLKQIRTADWGHGTNLQATFRQILYVAQRHNVPEHEMPTMVLIISDMEFDSACSQTNLDAIRQQYVQSGYELPKLVFWNVNSISNNNLPAKFNDDGVGLVSGASPAIIKSVLSGEIQPEKIMLRTLNNPRYDRIKCE